MAIDESPRHEPVIVSSESSHTGKFVAIFIVLALLAVGQLYTMSKIGTVQESLATEQATFQKTITGQLDQQITARAATTDDATAQEIEG